MIGESYKRNLNNAIKLFLDDKYSVDHTYTYKNINGVDQIIKYNTTVISSAVVGNTL